jgi:alpha-glucosidase
MDARKVFTLDPERFPLPKMRELVQYLHSHQQHYIVMVDPAVAYQDYPAFNNGADQDAFLKLENGSIYSGVVWPGKTSFPDWFADGTQEYWNSEFASFFNPDFGVDIDGLWIDMNEPANFCNYPCEDPEGYAKENNFPPEPPAVRKGSDTALPGFPDDFQPASNTTKRQVSTGSMMGLSGRELIDPPYSIQNAAGSISNKSANTNLVQ